MNFQTKEPIDLFNEAIVALTGMESHIPDLLWAATPEDLQGAHPLAVYFYEWIEVDQETFYKAKLEGRSPLVNLGVGGLYVGQKREEEALKGFDVLDLLSIVHESERGSASYS